MGAAAASVLLVAILLQRRDRAALLLAALTLSYVLWSFGRGARTIGYTWGPTLTGVSLCWIGPLALGFAAELSGRRTELRRIGSVVLVGTLLLAGAVLAPSTLGRVAEVGAHVWSLAGLGLGALLLARFAPADADNSPDFTRLRYLAIAHAGVFGGAVFDLLMWQVELPMIGTLLPPLFYLYAGYLHLAQVRVADLRQLLGDTVALMLMAAGLAGLFAAIRIWVGSELDLFIFNTFVASFAVLLFFQPVRDRIQTAMDRTFVASRLELERSLQPLRERLAQIVTLDELLEELLNTLENTDRLRASSIFLCDDPTVGFQQVGSFGQPSRTRVSLIRDPVWIEALESRPSLLLDELERARVQSTNDEEWRRLGLLYRTMRDLDAQLVLPLRAGSLVGFWTLTDTREEEPFSTDEVRLLRGVADRVGVTIENSKTFERIRARDQLVSLGEMSAGLAHEIRNPLASIRGALAVLEDPEGPQDEDIQQVIVEEIQRLNRVVETFLDYARPATRRTPVEHLGEFVRRCAQGVARQKQRDDVKLRLAIASTLPPVSVGADQLERVLTNVVQNAYEAIEGEGEIRVSARLVDAAVPLGEHVEITVADDGPGMNEATLQRALVPFFTTKDRGSGLGLALCERLLGAQGGLIELRSQPGEGTVVLIRLPSASADEVTEA
jgi:signal transduction histidine kinase